MTTYWYSWLWKSSITIAFILSGSTVFASGRVVLAEIIPDETLGNESSVVTPDRIKGKESDRISGGAVRGSNLFHSFREFNIGEGKGGYFENPAAIENIFSRVTGSNPSNILGTLGVLGNANLFFLNPNGILFGANASLDLRGSFLATTADSIIFPDGNQFSATNPEAPPLLTVNVQQPIGLEFEGREGTISNQGNLAVEVDRNLALVGGDVTIDGVEIISPGSNIILGGLNQAGTININPDLSLGFPQGITRGNVSLINSTVLDVAGNDGGNITINAQNINISNSQVLAGIGEGLGFENAQAGDIKLDVTETLAIENSFILNDVNSNAWGDSGRIVINAQDIIIKSSVIASGNIAGIGNSGEIAIDTSTLSLTKGGIIAASTFGEGDAGVVKIAASEGITLDGETSNGFPSSILSTVEPSAVGNSRGIFIDTSILSLTNGGQLSAATFGEGDAGIVKIAASEGITLDGEASDGLPSWILSTVEPNAVGNSGTIVINTSTLSLTNGGLISATTFGEGDAGAVQVTASKGIFLDGERSNAFPSGIFNQVERNAVGDSGGIVIDTATLSLTNGGQISAITVGQGDAGIVQVTASEGIFLDGDTSNNFPSRILNQVERNAVGNSRGIVIDTTTLSLTSGAQISASNFGTGNAGNIEITASELLFLSGGAFSDILNREIGGILAFTLTRGKAGNITIDTPQLTISEGSGIEAFTQGEGQAGDITIQATESLILNTDTQLTVETSDAGKPGNIEITTPSLTIGKDAEISATATETSTNTEGGSSINIMTSNLDLTGKLGIFAETQGKTPAGTLDIQPYQDRGELDIQFTDTAIISSSTTASGAGGNINLTAPETINISGKGKVTVETTGGGDAGSINIETKDLNISNQTEISASTLGTGEAGDINITAANLNLSEGAKLFTNTTGSLPGGDINLTISDLLTLRNNSQITATAGTDEAGGDGGNIDIDAPFIIAFPNQDNNITANAFEGDGGNITINTKGIFGIEFRERETPLSDITASSESGQQGEVEINTSAIDPTRGLNNLPQDTVEAEVAQSCQTVGGKSTLEFFAIGRGGLPPSPDDLFSSEIVIAEWIPLALADEKKQAPTSEKSLTGDEMKNMTLLTNFLCQSK